MLVHELAHALVARTIGVPTAEIRLFVFGGVARIAGEPADAGGEALVAMAGPLASVILAGLFALASWAVAGPAGDLLAWLFVGNLVVAGFNLLPGFPLDGGRVARALVWRAHRAAPARHQGHRRPRPHPGRRPGPRRGRGRHLAADAPLAAPGRPRPVPVAGRRRRRTLRHRTRTCSPGGPSAGSLMPMVVTARLRPPDRIVEVADVRRVADLLARLEVLPGAVLVIRDGALLTSQDELRDGDKVEVRFAISGGG